MMDMKRLQEKEVALEDQRLQWDLDNHCTGLFDQRGDEEWEKLMIDMDRLQEKKIALENQGLQKDLVQRMALQRQLEEDRSHFGNWVDEQSLERLELGAEKKLRMEEVHELDRMWDSIRQKGEYEDATPSMREKARRMDSGVGLHLSRKAEDGVGLKTSSDLDAEILEREKELKRREERLRREERRLEEIAQAEKERNLRKREDKLRRRERELETIFSAKSSRGRSDTRDEGGRRGRSRSGERSRSRSRRPHGRRTSNGRKRSGERSRSRSRKPHGKRELNGRRRSDDKSRSRGRGENQDAWSRRRRSRSSERQKKTYEQLALNELTLKVSIPNRCEDMRSLHDVRDCREVVNKLRCQSRESSSKGEDRKNSSCFSRADHDYQLEKDLREKEMRVNKMFEEQQGRARKGRYRRNRRRKEPSNFAREQDFEDSSQDNAWSKYYSQGDTDSTWRAPVKWRLGVRRAVKERLGMRREEAVEDLDLAEYEERIISELQERDPEFDAQEDFVPGDNSCSEEYGETCI